MEFLCVFGFARDQEQMREKNINAFGPGVIENAPEITNIVQINNGSCALTPEMVKFEPISKGIESVQDRFFIALCLLHTETNEIHVEVLAEASNGHSWIIKGNKTPVFSWGILEDSGREIIAKLLTGESVNGYILNPKQQP